MEGAQRASVGRDREVSVVPRDDPPQPPALLGDRLVHPLAKALLDLLQLGPHAMARVFRWSWKRPERDFPQMWGRVGRRDFAASLS